MARPADSTTDRRAAAARRRARRGPAGRRAPGASASGRGGLGVVVAGVLCLAGAAPRDARAAPPAGGTSRPEGDKARARYRAALDAFEAGRFRDALAALDEVAAQKEAAVVFYYRGICQARLGQWVQAEGDFARAVTLAANRPDADHKHVFAESQKALLEVRAHLTDVALVVRPVDPEALPEVTFDGAPLPSYVVPQLNRDRATWGPLRVVKGEHTFAVTHPQHAPLQATFVAPEAGDGKGLQTVRLEWPDARPRRETTPAPPPPKAAPGPPGGSAQITPWAVGGIGIGLAAASLGLFAAHLARGQNGADDAPYLVPALVAGGGATAAGALSWALAGASRPGPAAGAGAAKARPSVLVPLGVPRGGGVAWAVALW
ncbi:MAG TPA: hypothetical protein VFS43_37040 [Polyangiaceae bacterium]|nr:hypothetical protein [Polyangiaceae bacterium]